LDAFSAGETGAERAARARDAASPRARRTRPEARRGNPVRRKRRDRGERRPESFRAARAAALEGALLGAARRGLRAHAFPRLRTWSVRRAACALLSHLRACGARRRT